MYNDDDLMMYTAYNNLSQCLYVVDYWKNRDTVFSQLFKDYLRSTDKVTGDGVTLQHKDDPCNLKSLYWTKLILGEVYA